MGRLRKTDIRTLTNPGSFFYLLHQWTAKPLVGFLLILVPNLTVETYIPFHRSVMDIYCIYIEALDIGTATVTFGE